MTQKTPDFLTKTLQQLSQAWSKLAPIVQLQLVKFLEVAIPALEKFRTNLVVTSSIDSQVLDSSSSKFTTTLKTQSAKAIQIVIQGFKLAQTKLGIPGTVVPSDINTDAAIATPEIPAPSDAPKLPSTSGDRIAGIDPEQVKAEVNTAWTFVKEQAVPKALSGLTWFAEKIDPPLTSAWQTISQKAQSTPNLVNAWTKVKTSEVWQKGSTAIAPFGRFLGEKLEPIANSENVKPLLEKRVAVSTMSAVLVLLILFKPSPASHTVARSPKVFTQPSNSLIVPPERGDAPISPEQIMITDIQSQVADVSKKYGESLIQSVETNFRLGRLIVQLTDDWFQLSSTKQDRLMAELFERSQALNFKKLFIADPERHLLARSPSVGSDMVILKR